MGLVGNLVSRLKGFFARSKRVFIISKKPGWQEYKTMAKVIAIGIAIIAVIGFIVQLIFALTGIGF